MIQRSLLIKRMCNKPYAFMEKNVENTFYVKEIIYTFFNLSNK